MLLLRELVVLVMSSHRLLGLHTQHRSFTISWAAQTRPWAVNGGR